MLWGPQLEPTVNTECRPSGHTSWSEAYLIPLQQQGALPAIYVDTTAIALKLLQTRQSKITGPGPSEHSLPPVRLRDKNHFRWIPCKLGSNCPPEIRGAALPNRNVTFLPAKYRPAYKRTHKTRQHLLLLRWNVMYETKPY